MFGLSAVAAVIQGVAMIFLPKTPQFLMICKQVIFGELFSRATIQNLTSLNPSEKQFCQDNKTRVFF
jgi:hypothetical protein